MAVTSMANSSIRDFRKFNTMNAFVNFGFDADYLVIAGGGPGGYGGQAAGGGGGAGGYIEGTQSALNLGDSFTVTIGAGGTSPKAGPYANGVNSVYGSFTAQGGGYGGGRAIEGATVSPSTGGSGGGGRTDNVGGAASNAISPELGNAGATASTTQGGGGGGAGAAGTRPNGGAGQSSTITGLPVGRAGGGGGGAESGATGSSADGGGAGGTSGNGSGTAGTINTGGGGGGGSSNIVADRGGGAGGSGVVILRYPVGLTLTVGAGLTSSTATDGAFKVTTFTAGTDTVTF